MPYRSERSIVLQPVQMSPKSLADYAPIVGEQVVETIRQEAKELAGAKVLHINATAYGGGVAEILKSLVPLMRDVRIGEEAPKSGKTRVTYGAQKRWQLIARLD